MWNCRHCSTLFWYPFSHQPSLSHSHSFSVTPSIPHLFILLHILGHIWAQFEIHCNRKSGIINKIQAKKTRVYYTFTTSKIEFPNSANNSTKIKNNEKDKPTYGQCCFEPVSRTRQAGRALCCMCVCMYFLIRLHAIRLLTQYKALKFDPIIRSCRKTFNELATQPKSFGKNGCILIMSTAALFLTLTQFCRCCSESARDPIALIITHTQ